MAEQQVTNITVLGGGAWGRGLAMLAQRKGGKVRVWSRRTGEPLAPAIADCDLVVSAIAMAGVAEMAAQLQAIGLPPSAILLSATKGLESMTSRTPSQIWQATFPDHAVVVLSGPNLAKELALGLPAATVVASQNLKAATIVQQVFASDRFRVYTNKDPLGTELGGALKNVIAIAVGVCDGLQLGMNAKSALITRALPEIIRIGTHLGAQPETFVGLSGLGDLLATCNSPLSRNYQVGFGLAQGKSLSEVLATIEGTAEGVNTARVLADLASREHLSMPICRLVAQLLDNTITPQEAVYALMERDLKPESCNLF